MSWLDLHTSLFNCPAENRGRIRTYRQILLCDFAVPHPWFYKDSASNSWVNGVSNDLSTIVELRGLDESRDSYQRDKQLAKQTLQCYTPSACFESKKKGQENRLHINPILQLDFDNLDQYDLDEVREAIADLPFVGFVSKSVSGTGLFALLLIQEPEQLKDSAEYCFSVFAKNGLPADTTKGRNYTDLRFVSYDDSMFIRDEPKPLKIKRFNTPKPAARHNVQRQPTSNGDKLLEWAVNEIRNAQVGQRFETVRKVSYTMGGHGFGIDDLKQAVRESSQYAGVESKYLNHVDECFKAGQSKPIAV